MTTRDNSGTLSRNTRKEKDSHPDLRGKATIDGVEYWISGWRKTGDDGTWFSLAFQRKDATPQQRAASKRRPDDDDSDIPY